MRKILNLCKLGLTCFREYKGRSSFIVLTTALLFGCILGYNAILQGLENSIVEASMQQTNQKCYTAVTAGEIAPNGQNLTDYFMSYGGELIGNYYRYGNAIDVPMSTQVNLDSIIDGPAASKITNINKEIPSGKIPVLTPDQAKQSFIQVPGNTALAPVNTSENQQYFTIGTYPISNQSIPYLEMPVLIKFLFPEQISFFSLGTFIVNTDQSVQSYINQQVKQWQQDELAQNAQFYLQTDGTHIKPKPVINKYTIISFDDYNKMAEAASRIIYSGHPNPLRAIFGNTPDVYSSFRLADLSIYVVEFILIIIAIVIAAFTFKHLIIHDRSNIALYYAMGASTGQIAVIYLSFLFSLTVLSILASLIIALCLSGIVTLTSSTELTASLQNFYILEQLSPSNFFAINNEFYIIIILMLLLPILTILFSLKTIRRSRKFSQQLKADT